MATSLIALQSPAAEVCSAGVISDEKRQWRLTFTPDASLRPGSLGDFFVTPPAAIPALGRP